MSISPFRFMLILQCVFETVPGLLLQLTFWIKSSNDPILSGDKDTFLIPFSIAVSVITITDRYGSCPLITLLSVSFAFSVFP